MNEIKDRIEALRLELNRHNHAYYVNASPTVSDYEYDMLMKELEGLENAYPEFDDALSPTHRVGSDISTKFSQVIHARPMLSLGNTYSIGEVDEWVNRCDDLLGSENVEIVGEMKFDGTSISITYRHGRLVRAVTRGDGEKGDDVTANVLTIKSIPIQLLPGDWPDEFEIRGEIVLPWRSFEKLNEERAFNEEPLFANPRNAAAGTLKLQNSKEVSRRGLDAYFYYLLSDRLPCDTHFDNMEKARQWGFKVSDAMKRLDTIASVDEYITHWDKARRELPVATDGLVFKVNSLRQQLNLGYTSKSPRWAIAYKFQAERAATRLRHVSFEVGRMGIVTPVANLEPVLLSGTVVKRASLHNADIVRQLDIHQHDMLYVEKGGEIIPKIVGVDVAERKPASEPVRFVTHCPDCGTPLVKEPGEAAWVCPNKYGCKPQIIGRIEHFVGRHMMNIDGIGEETATLLYEKGLVKSSADLYDLTVDALMKLDRFAQRSAERVVEGIETSKAVGFERVLYALSIPFVGETVAKKLARSVGSMERLVNMSQQELVAVEDIGPKIADSIIEYFANPLNALNLQRLQDAGLQMAVMADTTPGSDALSGKTIVISGVFSLHSREEYKDMIERNGGKNSGSISKKTSMILAGENMGPAKLEKAKSLGIPLVSEEEFLKLLE